MKLLIKREFRDKITGELYKEGSVVEFAEDRAKEILADTRSLAEEAKEEPKKKTAAKKTVAKKK